MSRQITRCILFVIVAALLQGCFAVIVGGAATGAHVVHDRRSFGTVVSDRNIQLTAIDTINRHKELVRDDNNVKVVVYDGVMLLCGQLRSEDLKIEVQALVKDIEGIQRLVNELEVTDEPQGFWRRREDNTISARVKTSFLDITSMHGFDPTRVSVTTSHHVVYLMGLITHEEAEAVTDIARNVAGVDKVVKVFEYTD